MTRLAVCPHCKTGQYVGKHFYAKQCSNCKKVFNKDNMLSESEMEDLKIQSSMPMNPEKLKQKVAIEKQAYEFKEKTMDRKNKGIQRHHEPDGQKRRW